MHCRESKCKDRSLKLRSLFINSRFYEIFVSLLGVGYFPIGNLVFLILYLNPLTIRSMCIVKLDLTRIGSKGGYVSDKSELSNIVHVATLFALDSIRSP